MRRWIGLAAVALAVAVGMPGVSARAQDAGKRVYDEVKSFKLTGGSAEVSALTLKRDRVEMTFTGTFYFGAATGGRVTGAVFIGQGTIKAETPPNVFERENIKRLLNVDNFDSDFRTAVLRFSDDTFVTIGASRRDDVTVPAAAQKLADETDPRIMQELGANLVSRITNSILNAEPGGVFHAQFDGGRRGRFNFLLDPEGRLQVAHFGLNGGEKGLIYQYQSAILYPEVWLAFYGLDDYAKNAVTYSDANDVVDVTNYTLNLDVRAVPRMKMQAVIDLKMRKANARAVSFSIGESLSTFQNGRLNYQLRVKRAALGGQELAWVQEDWEGGFTVYLPKAAAQNDALQLTVDLEGDFLQVLGAFPECFYPYNNVTWLPRHGYLDRATFEMTFKHRRRDKVAAVGTRLSEGDDPADPQGSITKYKFGHQVPLATFALGPWERKSKQVTFESGGPAIPVEFNSVPARVLAKTTMPAVNSDLILDELDNAVRYFNAYFGRYPYDSFGAAFHPFNFGQGFPTLLMIPPATRGAETAVFSFFAHETAHQWWGNIVAWRSYRDQWLSEGFAEYSGLLYAAKRTKDSTRLTLDTLKYMREALVQLPRTASGGVGKTRLNDIGPISQGHRLNTTQSGGAYQTLIYAKGALVLRMLHFLLSNPVNGTDVAFTAMMKEFVDKHRDGAARTEDFARIAGAHFATSPIATKFGLRDLDWFFRQWVHGTGLPTYALEYELKPQTDGSLMLAGTIKQDNVPQDFMMVLPVILSFDANQEYRTTVRATGPSSTFELRLPSKPRKIELDPFSWVLSEKTTTRAK